MKDKLPLPKPVRGSNGGGGGDRQDTERVQIMMAIEFREGRNMKELYMESV